MNYYPCGSNRAVELMAAATDLAASLQQSPLSPSRTGSLSQSLTQGNSGNMFIIFTLMLVAVS